VLLLRALLLSARAQRGCHRLHATPAGSDTSPRAADRAL
jgi:hypothetical protein